jgi:3D (Asp-Asp-Asp) domain-containing protein
MCLSGQDKKIDLFVAEMQQVLSKIRKKIKLP